MGLKKFKNLFTGSAQKKSSSTSNTKEIKMAAPAIDTEKSPKRKSPSTSDIEDKAKVEQLQKIIQKKLKDPQNAKKAAQIIEEMLKNGSSK